MRNDTEGLVSFLGEEAPEPRIGDPGPGHRRRDRPTSKAAATNQQKGLSELRLDALRTLVEIDRTSPGKGATAYELMIRMAYSGHAPAQNICVKRLGDLRSMGLAYETGEHRLGGAGQPLIVFRPTDLGRHQAAQPKEADS